MSDPSQIILLVEDSRHQQFTYKYLRQLGFGPHAIRIKMSPSGYGSAEQWVREQFPIEYGACQKRNAKAQTKLIVVIDADTRTVQERLQELDQALRDAGVHTTKGNITDIVRLIPKRNIETWILCLNNRTVDEATDYKNPQDDWTPLTAKAVKILFKWTHQNAAVPDSCVDSLRSGLTELQKLKDNRS